MIIRAYLLAFVALTACGDNIKPDLTWGDAEAVWATAWCDYAQKCYPDEYAEVYKTDQECFDAVYWLNCELSEIDCSADYPDDRWFSLQQCEADMADIACTALTAPYSCYTAFTDPAEESSRIMDESFPGIYLMRKL